MKRFNKVRQLRKRAMDNERLRYPAMRIFNKARQLTDELMGNERWHYPRDVNVWEPNDETISFIKRTECRHIAEVGIFKGHTSLEFAKFLNGEGELHLFDYEDRVKEVAKTLEKAGFHNVRTFGSSYKLLDSYNWSLAKVLEQNTEPVYDYVFLDGAHTWAVDALTTFLADRLLKVKGYLDFDDYNWSLGESEVLNPKVFRLTGKLYTGEQISAKQVRMVVDLIIRRDSRYREVVANKIFQKMA